MIWLKHSLRVPKFSQVRFGGALEKFDVGVAGAGYVGLITGVCLAHIGHRVTIMDVNAERIAALNRGEVPIYEPHLDEFLAKNADRLRFTTDLAPVVRESDVLFIAVNTPPEKDGSRAARASSSTNPYRRTIPNCAARTYPAPGRFWGGNHKSRPGRVSAGRSNGSPGGV